MSADEKTCWIQVQLGGYCFSILGWYSNQRRPLLFSAFWRPDSRLLNLWRRTGKHFILYLKIRSIRKATWLAVGCRLVHNDAKKASSVVSAWGRQTARDKPERTKGVEKDDCYGMQRRWLTTARYLAAASRRTSIILPKEASNHQTLILWAE